MYLKKLEIIGFKSFADRTLLTFEPGVTAIVGPNGCGKSNISDSIRWVLGEQSAKALRGSKMEDCIFNGTDARKPLNMAEVNITFADCEASLGTEFNEVTVTRRVFRSGQGEYAINKTVCRLKDVQRMFMDTGIGTTAYSFLEQGRIDRVLSSRPEDRRAVFEEASGITKFKSDKNEAIRKLEHTEANLLRLADVIAEVKRQIGSLQRQAGKARRYKVLHDELRQLDIFSTRERVRILDADILSTEGQVNAGNEALRSTKSGIDELDHQLSAVRDEILRKEREIGGSMERGAQARSNLEHAREMIVMNSQRIGEYKGRSDRDRQEVERVQLQLDDQRKFLAQFEERLAAARNEALSAEKELRQSSERLAAHQREMDELRLRLQAGRNRSVELENTSARLQNQLAQIDSQEHSDTLHRERLHAEKIQIERVVKGYTTRQSDMAGLLETLGEQVEDAAARVGALHEQQAENSRRSAEQQHELTDLKSAASGLNAKLELLRKSDNQEEGYLEGTKQLLAEANPLGIDRAAILGTLAAAISTPKEYRTALEAVIRYAIDALLVRDQAAAIAILQQLAAKAGAPAKLIVMNTGNPDVGRTVPAGADCLLDHVTCDETTRSLAQRLFGHVMVVDSPAAAPQPIPEALVCITREGIILRGNGSGEFWPAGSQPGNPLARKHLIADLEKELAANREQVATFDQRRAELVQRTTALTSEMRNAQAALDEQRQMLAAKRGESQLVNHEARQAQERFNTIDAELGALSPEDNAAGRARAELAAEMTRTREEREKRAREIEAETLKLREKEASLTALQTQLTEHSVRFAQLRQEVTHLDNQVSSTRLRLTELDALAKARSEDLQNYTESITRLEQTLHEAESSIGELEEAVQNSAGEVETLRAARETLVAQVEEQDKILAARRASLDELHNSREDLAVHLNECKIKRQNGVDRVLSEYDLTFEALMTSADPQWEGEPPSMDSIETTIAELRMKIEAMGPVNLVAIEEHQELEERFAFLTKQEEDLVNAKSQLMEMIHKINATTSELFSQTFAQINENFQSMFNTLFGGGTAKLVLVNEEDVLECGIEIIARPPGKRLQNISLLSGGERTMTAVALLFSIYMIKPSPFCLLDEMDAALDDSNIGRFISILKSFLDRSQFMVITHNRQTIAAANILYGVTMPQKGISKLVSMKFAGRQTAPPPPLAQEDPNTPPPVNPADLSVADAVRLAAPPRE